MDKPADSRLWEFAQFTLLRNDEAIRFSETKAALLLTLTGLLLGVVVDKILQLNEIHQNQSWIISIINVSSILTILVGIILVTITSLAAIYPRLKVGKETSYFYFGDLANFNEEETIGRFAGLDDCTTLNCILSQIHATSTIANRKFGLIKYAMVGAVLVIIGSILAILALFIS